MNIDFVERIVQINQRRVIALTTLLFIALVAAALVVKLPQTLSFEYCIAVPLGAIVGVILAGGIVQAMEYQKQKKLIDVLKQHHTTGLEFDKYFLLFYLPASLKFKPKNEAPLTNNVGYEFLMLPSSVVEPIIDVMIDGLSLTKVTLNMEEWAKSGNVILVFTGKKVPEQFSFLRSGYRRKQSSTEAIGALRII